MYYYVYVYTDMKNVQKERNLCYFVVKSWHIC